MNWYKQINNSSPENVMLWTKIHDENGERNIQKLKRQGNLWFDDTGIYVYYQPTHWSY